MGGVVSSVGDAVGDVIGGVGGVVSGVANQIPVIGPYVGPVVGGITGGPVGFATSLAGNALQGNYGGGGGGGGGGSSTPMYAQPNISYGNNTYSYGGNKVNASPYFITGDKGVYNLLPALGQINAGTNQMQYSPSSFGRNPSKGVERFNKIGAANAYTPYEAYQDIQAQMANDPTALAAFNKAYSPTTFNAPGFQLFGKTLPVGAPNPTSPLGQFYANSPNPYGNQFVNFGLNSAIKNQPDLTYSELSKYAVENKNPFFLPFETTQGATPLGFTPSASALAPIDTANYLSGFNTANTAQQQFVRDQQQAARATQEAQRQAQINQRNAQRDQRDAQRDQRDAQRDQRNTRIDQDFGQSQVQQPQPANPQQRGLGGLQLDKFKRRLG
jgi:hypothetical protein